MNDRRIKRLESLVHERVALVLMRDLHDPRLGFVTITRVQIDAELAHCKVFYSVLGDEKGRRMQQELLDHAAKYVQHELAAVLTTRTVPQVRFVFDESIAGAMRVAGIIEKTRQERLAREHQQGGPA